MKINESNQDDSHVVPSKIAEDFFGNSFCNEEVYRSAAAMESLVMHATRVTIV